MDSSEEIGTVLRRMRLTLAIILTLLPSCGWLTLGGGTGGNDPRPSGTILSSGSFSGQNGSTVSGTAIIYRDSESLALTLRIEGLSISPSANTFRLIAEVNGTDDFSTNLTSVSGNKNYATNVAFPSTIARVLLESLTQTPAQIASATLVPVN